MNVQLGRCRDIANDECRIKVPGIECNNSKRFYQEDFIVHLLHSPERCKEVSLIRFLHLLAPKLPSLDVPKAFSQTFQGKPQHLCDKLDSKDVTDRLN